MVVQSCLVTILIYYHLFILLMLRTLVEEIYSLYLFVLIYKKNMLYEKHFVCCIYDSLYDGLS